MNQRIVITNPEFDGTNLEGGRTPKKRGESKSSGPPIKQAGGSRGEGREREEKRADAMNVVSSIISTLIDNTYDCAVVVVQQEQTDQLGGEIASGIEGEGESPEGSSGDTDSESSDEETASSSEDDSARAVGTASGERENWKLQETVEDGFTRVSTREEKRQAKREVQKEKEKNRVELAAKAMEEERKDREIQRKLLAEASQRNPQTRARTARERQEAQAKEAEGRAQRPGAQKGGGRADWLEEDGEGGGEGVLAGAEGGQMELGGGRRALGSTPQSRP